MVATALPQSDSQSIFGGFYQLQIRNSEVIISATIEKPQSGTNTIIGADVVDWEV